MVWHLGPCRLSAAAFRNGTIRDYLESFRRREWCESETILARRALLSLPALLLLSLPALLSLRSLVFLALRSLCFFSLSTLPVLPSSLRSLRFLALYAPSASFLAAGSRWLFRGMPRTTQWTKPACFSGFLCARQPAACADRPAAVNALQAANVVGPGQTVN